MSTSDTTPLLAGRNNNNLQPNSASPQGNHPRSRTAHSSTGTSYTPDIAGPGTVGNNNANPNNNPSQRHWSEETEDILGPDHNSSGHQNTGAGYRRRSHRPAPHSDLDAQRFSGQDRPTGAKRVFYSCCCWPCQRAIAHFQQKYSRTEKISMGVATLFFLLAVGFLCAYVRAREALPLSGKNGICTSRECTIVAADILRDMKPEVDPCTDFFTFNCGGFVDRVSIPDDKNQIGYFTLVQKQNQGIIRSILSPETTAVRGKDDASKRNLAKLQSLYESCMDEKKLSEVGVKPLVDLVQKLIKIFPATFSVLDTDHPSESGLEKLRQINTRMEPQQDSLRVQISAQEDGGHDELHKDGQSVFTAIAGPFLGKDAEQQEQQAAFIRADRETLALAIAQLASLDVTTVVEFDVDSDPKRPEQNVFKMGESGLGLPSKEYYTEEKIVAIYQTAVEDMFGLVLGKDNKEGLKGDAVDLVKPVLWAEVAKNVVEFEKLIAAISSNPEDLENSELSYNPRSLHEITELVPNIDWSLVLEKLFAKGSNVPDPIVVSSPDYLEKLNALLKETPAMTLQNYFAWRLIQRLSPGLAIEFRKPMMTLKAALQGVSADLVSPRWETCVDVVDKTLGAMAGHYFIEKAFQGDSKEMADSIITSLKTAFLKGLSRLEWLDQPTLMNATEKVDLLLQKIGYSVESPDVRSSESLEEYFKDLGIDRADFFGNQIRSRIWSTRQMLTDLAKPVDRAKWLMTPQTVNAYYNPGVNEIVFPAGILQQPFFHGDNPEYLNYGSFGVVAGHELSHAFDDEGRRYDARGKLSDWWSNSTLAEFNTRSQCFIDQYGNFTVKDPQGRENHVNGKLTLGENLADNGGLKTSFDAWQARFKSDPHGNKYKNHLLSGLEDYSREQLYYISFARAWCSQKRPASAIESLRTDPHSPAKWRVNGAVQNSKHFAEVFNCKSRSAMNPDNKCEMW